MDIRRFFGGQTTKSGSSAGTSKTSGVGAKASGDSGEKSGRGKRRGKESNGKRRKSSRTSESDGTPTKGSKSHKHRKKNVIDSDSSGEEPLPPKLRKTSSESGSKTKAVAQEVLSSDEEAALPPRLSKTTKNESSKPNGKESSAIKKSPVKVVQKLSDYFGDKPVERSFRKTLASKRKERSEDTATVQTDNHQADSSNDNSSNKPTICINLDSPDEDVFHEQPHKKAKKTPRETQPSSSKSSKENLKKQTEKMSSASEKHMKSETEISKPSQLKSSPKKVEESVTSTKDVKSERKSITKPSPKKSSPTKPSSAKSSPTKSKEKEVEHSQYFSKKSTPTKTASLSKSEGKSVSTNIEKSGTDLKSTTPVKSTPGKLKESDTPDVVPSSLERKASGYRSFMSREGPKALGSKEIPKVFPMRVSLEEGSESCLGGLTFVVTGVLESIEREDALDLIKRHGGKVTQSLSKKTTYIVVGRDPGASKIEKAEKLGTKHIDEDGLFDLIRKSNDRATKTSDDSSKNRKQKAPSPSLSTPSKSESQTSVDLSPSQKLSQSSVFSSASSTPATQTPSASPLAKGVESESLLWVDKYSPKTIKQIIGQKGDRSNVKKLLHWLQNWHVNQKSGKPKAGYFSGKEDGSIFKAALLSGPPGVGKTTSAQLVCKEVGFSFVEFNASDSRSKKTLEEYVSEVLGNKTIDGFLSNAGPRTSSENHVLIMDEVDGMAGNEDRGGMQELIHLIKTTKIPIICMCNDRNSQKVRSLANHCFDLRFHRPRVEQIKGAMMTIAFKENLKISPQAMEKVVIGANQDVRQVLYNLCMWTSKQKSMSYDEAKADADKAHKDIKLGPFDVTRKIFSSEESSKLSMQEYFSLFFNDYSLIPLFSQENYINVVPYSAAGDPKKILKSLSEAADSLCDSDLVDKAIRSNGCWNLLPLQSFFSCVLPGKIMKGGIGQKIDFPSWLGKNSTTGKNSRILQDLLSHAELSVSGGKLEFNMDYIPHLRNVLTRPLINANSENCSSKVSEVIQIMDSYHLMKEDWDNILEVGQFPGKVKPQSQIESKVKSAFTRTYNKESHLAPYSLQTTAKKNRGAAFSDELGDLDNNNGGEGEDDDDDDDNIEKNSMIKVKKTSGSKGKKASQTSSKTKESKGAKGKGASKGKGKNK